MSAYCRGQIDQYVPGERNVSVAAIERPESLARPETPWALVQPLPQTEPKPAIRPAEAIKAKFEDTVCMTG